MSQSAKNKKKTQTLGGARKDRRLRIERRYLDSLQDKWPYNVLPKKEV